MQDDRVRLAIGRTIPSPSSTSAGCFACKQDSGRAKALGVRRQCQTAPTRMRRGMPCSIVKAAEPVHQLACSWLQYRLTLASSTVLSKPKLPLSNFRAKAVESERELTSTPNNSYGTLAKTIKTINCSFLPPYNVYLTWLAMRLAY